VLNYCTTYISCEVEEFAVLVEPGGPLPGNDLEEQDAEAEHVGFDGEEALGSVLRRDVTTGHKKCRSYEHRATRSSTETSSDFDHYYYLLRADDPGGVGLGDVGAEDPGHAEVGDLGAHVAVQEDVAGLEVPVDDPQARVLVQVEQALRDAVDDAEPPLPGQDLPFLSVCR
jgi:hypothetical protein